MKRRYLLLGFMACGAVGLGWQQHVQLRAGEAELARMRRILAAQVKTAQADVMPPAPEPAPLPPAPAPPPASEPLQPVASGDATFDAESTRLLQRVIQIKAEFARHPELHIPELRYLDDAEWFSLAADGRSLDTDNSLRSVFGELRARAKMNFLQLIQSALRDHLNVHDRLPADIAGLQPHFVHPVEPALLARYRMGASAATDPRAPNARLVEEIPESAVDPAHDRVAWVGLQRVSVEMSRPPSRP